MEEPSRPTDATINGPLEFLSLRSGSLCCLRDLFSEVNQVPSFGLKTESQPWPFQW